MLNNLSRRGFWGGLLGLIGIGASKAEEGKKTWTKVVMNDPAAYKRLLQAMRSMRPGGWSEDHWEQSKREDLYSIVHRRSELFAQSTFQVLRDGKEISKDDPCEGGRACRPYDLVTLLSKPNERDSWADLAYSWNQQMDLTGRALTHMVPNKLGIPYELYVIPTAIAIPQPAINPDYPDGYYRIQPIYPYGPFSSYPTPATAVGAPIPAQWMLRFKYPHPLFTCEGYAPLAALRKHLDEVEKMDGGRWFTMRRLINPSGILNFDDVPKMEKAEIERIRAEFEANFQGPENSGRLFVAVPARVDLKDLYKEDPYNAELLAKRISRYLTRHLAPFFGDNLKITISAKV